MVSSLDFKQFFLVSSEAVNAILQGRQTKTSVPTACPFLIPAETRGVQDRTNLKKKVNSLHQRSNEFIFGVNEC